MSTHATLAIMAGLAVALALVALVSVAMLWRATRLARAYTHRHDRRRRDEGPPPGTPERRHAGEGRARRRDVDDPQYGYREEPDVRQADAAHPAEQVRAQEPATYPPRPVPRHRAVDDEPATAEHAPPTADMRTLPPPGAIGR